MSTPVSRWCLCAFASALLAHSASSANPPPTQLFYVPFPEDHQLAGFSGINGAAVDPLAIFVTFSAATNETVIFYDHWEDGYERDITNPVQSTTLVFGDGNPANGYPPGNASDLIPAGTVFSLRNYVDSTTLGGVLDYDARDKVASYKPISLTKTSFPASTNTLLAGCVEVFEQGLWGTEYRVPVGEDMPTSTATATLTTDADIFAYTALSIMAGQRGATVQIDKDNNGAFETTVNLAEGQTTYVTAVNTGARVVSNHPVQVVLFSGRPGSNYQSRDSSLLPTYRWSSSYYAPVSTAAANGTCVFLYNPGASAITVSYDYRSSTSAYTTATVSVPAGGNARVNLAPASGTTHYGAYKFYTTGTTPPVFYAMTAVDANSTTTTNNQAYDGGFTLVGRPSLTTQVLVSLGIGRDPYSATNPTENGNPVWITTVGNGHTPAAVYVDFNGDNAGLLTDPNGNRYDVAYSLRELQQQKILDPDGDQSGMLVYTLDSTVKIAAAWAQDPTAATAGQPGLDVSTLLPPLREGEGGKKSSVAVDADGDGYLSGGDTLEYDIRGINSARSAIPGPFAVTDSLPGDVVYVPGSTRYRFQVGGAWQEWVSIPDDGSGTAFPLDGTGFSVPGNLTVGGQLQVTFRATVKNDGSLSGSTITNTGTVEISPYGLLLPIEWSDVVYGSIGDRVWQDLDGDGIQDAGEIGIPNIDVYADLNSNGVRDAGEPQSTTDSNGDYLLAGLTAGTYTVRVDPADIAAANVGYGPTYDLDGISSSHVAVVTLNSAQDRVDADFGYRVGASVGDRVWMDRDGDGVQESGEPGINGIRVYLDLDNDNAFDLGEPNTITNGDGTYYIGNLNPGTYTVRVDTTGLPAGATQTYDLNGTLDHEASVALIAAEHRGDLDFGYRGSLSIGDLVWDDPDADGTRVTYNVIDGRIDINNSATVDGSDDGTLAGFQIINGRVDLSGNASIGTEDDGTFQGITVIDGNLDTNGSGTISTTDDLAAGVATEAGLAGVRVYIDHNGNGQFDSGEIEATTNARGVYSITNLFNTTYSVRVDASTLPASYVQTYDLTAPFTDHAATVVMAGANRTDVDFAYRNDASLGDLVWNDRDGDGVRDPGEPGIEGVIVYIDADNDNIFDQGIERFAIADVNGFYQIGNLPAGTYPVRVEFSTLPQGATQTYDLDGVGTLHEASRTLATSENAVNVDFGYRSTSTVGDFVWNDLDADGVQDAGESGINGVRVYLDINGNGSFDSSTEPSSTTNSSGAYSIANLMPGNFTARVDVSTLPAGFVQTYDAVGVLDDAATFFVAANQTRSDIDFGYTQRATVGDLVWNDLDADGVQDGGETGIPGVSVTLFNAANDTIVATSVTSASGIYSISDIMPGTYYLVFDTPAGYRPTLADQGADTADSDPTAITGRTASFTLAGGQTNQTLDAGYYVPGSISGLVLADTDNDGDGDIPIENVLLRLLDSLGNAVLDGSGQPVTTLTLGNGSYAFGGLPPGDYCVVQDQPANFASVSDTDGLNNNIIGDQTPIVVTAGQNNGGNNFIEIELGSISGYVRTDDDNNGSGDTGLGGVVLNLLDSSGNPVLDGLGAPVQVATNAAGFYQFTLVFPGSYRVSQNQPAGYASVSDVDGVNNNLVGDETPIVITPGLAVTNRDFVEIQYGAISGRVFKDTNDDGVGDTVFPGVTVALLDGAGDPVDGDPVTPGVQPWTLVTGNDGSYRFPGLMPGIYQVSETQPSGFGSVSDVDGGNPDLIGNPTPITVNPGQEVIERDFVEIELGSISGHVFAGSTPLAGVTLTLLDEHGDPVDGDPGTPGVQPVTTVTDGSGFYQFTGVRPGIYQVGQTQPFGYDSFGDVDGGDIDIIGDVTPISLAPGQHSQNNDFVEALDTCPDDWAHWKFLHPAETPAGNPDQDAYDNFAEFAFAMPHDNGTGSPWLGHTAWIIRPSTLAPGTLEGVFIRHKGAPLNVTYTLQYAAVPGSPAVWQEIVITPAMITTSDNGDCTETVTIHDLESLTGLTGGKGVVRIRADLDDDGGNDEIDHTSFTEPEGWTETPLELCCRTYNNPYLRESSFTGTVSAVSGQNLTFAVSGGTADLASLLVSGTYFIEVTSGENEGHRYDIASASGNTVTLASDAVLDSSSAPFNTATGAPSASLVGDTVTIRRHWTLDETFPPSGFVATGSQSTADQVQAFAGGAWRIFWLYDENDSDPQTSRWVDAADSGMANQGATIIPPGHGLFFNNRGAVTSILAYGEVRTNDFIRPLPVGNSLVGGGFPLDQSASGTNSRQMGLATGFFGSRDFKTADSFFLWNKDANASAAGYATYFLLHGAPTMPSLLRWAKTGDNTAAPRDAEVLFLGNRAVFVRSKNGLPSYVIPAPWTP